MMPKSWNRFPACAKPLAQFVVLLDASAGEGRSETSCSSKTLERDGDSKEKPSRSNRSAPLRSHLRGMLPMALVFCDGATSRAWDSEICSGYIRKIGPRSEAGFTGQ